jgi:hypothetical protein
MEVALTFGARPTDSFREPTVQILTSGAQALAVDDRMTVSTRASVDWRGMVGLWSGMQVTGSGSRWW